MKSELDAMPLFLLDNLLKWSTDMFIVTLNPAVVKYNCFDFFFGLTRFLHALIDGNLMIEL